MTTPMLGVSSCHFDDRKLDKKMFRLFEESQNCLIDTGSPPVEFATWPVAMIDVTLHTWKCMW